MPPNQETAAMVALLRDGETLAGAAAAIRRSGSPLAALEDTRGLLAAQRLAQAVEQIEDWERRGIRLVSELDEGYPRALRSLEGRPPLLFLAGDLTAADERAVAIVGSRRATERGLSLAGALAESLVDRCYSIVSGLAAGIDTAAHTAALRAGGRTLAVIGTGLEHCYPPQNGALQREIALRGAVVSQFWPEAGPLPASFRTRNALTSGLSVASVIVEASPLSGARILARLALGQGRPVILLESLLAQEWARELASRPGVCVMHSPDEIVGLIERAEALQFSETTG